MANNGLAQFKTETKPTERQAAEGQTSANPLSSDDSGPHGTPASAGSVAEREVSHFGRVDVALREGVSGWAGRLDDPDATIDVIVFANGQRVARVRCDQPRPDLARMRVRGNTPHGFGFYFTSRRCLKNWTCVFPFGSPTWETLSQPATWRFRPHRLEPGWPLFWCDRSGALRVRPCSWSAWDGANEVVVARRAIRMRSECCHTTRPRIIF